MVVTTAVESLPVLLAVVADVVGSVTDDVGPVVAVIVMEPVEGGKVSVPDEPVVGVADAEPEPEPDEFVADALPGLGGTPTGDRRRNQ